MRSNKLKVSGLSRNIDTNELTLKRENSDILPSIDGSSNSKASNVSISCIYVISHTHLFTDGTPSLLEESVQLTSGEWHESGVAFQTEEVVFEVED